MVTVDTSAIVGLELRRLRKRAGLSQEQVARALGIPRPVVGRRECGKHLVTLENIAAHAAACGGSLAHVLLQVDLASGALQPGAGP